MRKLQQINKRATPIIVALGIVLSVVFGSYDTVKATGMEELFYYTYFDLMSGLFAETGAHFGLKDDYYTKSDRVSGKQVWDNFCTWVENKAKVAALPVEVVNKTVFDELKNLPNTVTSAGAKMSEKLSELLAKVLPGFETDNSISESSGVQIASYEQQRSLIASICGTSVDALPRYTFPVGNYLQIVSNSSGDILIFDSADPLICLNDGYYTTTSGNCGCPSGIIFSAGSYTAGYRIYPLKSYSFIVKNGLLVSADGTTISDYAKVKTVDDNTVYVPGVGYKTNWDIWKDIVNDKAITDAEEDAWNTRYNFDNDNKDDKEKKKKDNEKDKLPVAIPIIPFKKPDSSDKDKDKDTEQSTEKTSASPIINPKTGNVIDPETGYDIDPETGKLIDPKTGKLIDRDMSDTSSKLLKYGDIRKIFPFCIPFDIVDMIRGLRAEKAPPVFHFDYYFRGIDYTFTVDVDLSDYDKYIKLFRGGMVIFFVLALMWLTVKVSKFFS